MAEIRQCPECGGRAVKINEVWSHTRGGKVNLFRCKGCGHEFRGAK